MIHVDDHFLDYYSVDASGYSQRPRAIAFPQTVSDVASLVRQAVQNHTTLTIRGAGTGLVGGALGEDMILDTSCMNHIQYHDGLVFAGPGARLGAVSKLLRRYSRILGPNPSVGPYCSIGGMVSTNASGSLSLGYGSVIDNLEAVAVVDGMGEDIELPKDAPRSDTIYQICRRALPYPNTTKNSCGYRLDAVVSPAMSHKVLAASEGTLGVVVEAVFKTYMEPRRRALAVIEYTDPQVAAADCSRILECDPVSLEMMGPRILDGYEESCILFAEFHDTDVSLDLNYTDHIYDVVLYNTERRPTMIRHDIDRWLARRRSALSKSLRIITDNSPSIIEDAAVPLSRLPDLFGVIRELGEMTGSEPVYYGHAGSGNIHVRTPADSDATRWYLHKVIDMGGTITGEHGDGMGRMDFVRRQYGDANYQLFELLKDVFDPHHILNPRKVLSA